jgi:hypothetical protein
MRTCDVEDCGRPHRAGGYCATHYMRWQRYGDPLHLEQPVRRPPKPVPGALTAEEFERRLWRETDISLRDHPERWQFKTSGSGSSTLTRGMPA